MYHRAVKAISENIVCRIIGLILVYAVLAVLAFGFVSCLWTGECGGEERPGPHRYEFR